MEALTALIIPAILCLAAGIGLGKKIDIYDYLVSGAKNGMMVMANVIIVELFII